MPKYYENFHSLVPGKRLFIQLRVLTEENARSANMPYEEYKKRMLKAYDIDYSELKRRTDKLVNTLKCAQKIEIVTGEDNTRHVFSSQRNKQMSVV